MLLDGHFGGSWGIRASALSEAEVRDRTLALSALPGQLNACLLPCNRLVLAIRLAEYRCLNNFSNRCSNLVLRNSASMIVVEYLELTGT